MTLLVYCIHTHYQNMWCYGSFITKKNPFLLSIHAYGWSPNKLSVPPTKIAMKTRKEISVSNLEEWGSEDVTFFYLWIDILNDRLMKSIRKQWIEWDFNFKIHMWIYFSNEVFLTSFSLTNAPFRSRISTTFVFPSREATWIGI